MDDGKVEIELDLPEKTIAFLEEESIRLGTTMDELIEKMLRNYLEGLDAKKDKEKEDC